MNENHRNNLIKYRLERAQETFDEAILMKQEKHWNTCANRLYYACFYAVLALLEKYGFASSKHIGVKSLFNQHFIKTGKLSKEYGKTPRYKGGCHSCTIMVVPPCLVYPC